MTSEWRTPTHVREFICVRWGVTPSIDVCADSFNTQCDLFFGEDQNALAQDWVQCAQALNVEPVFWMNAPYTQPAMTAFIKKAIHEAKYGGVTVFLLPYWTDQAWYHDLIKQYPHEPMRGRVKFEPPPGVKPSSPRFGNIHGVIS
jgi:phage N-6-adenine-methyltransferase